MSTLSPEEQELFNVAKASIPKFFFAKDDSPQETLGAAAKVFAKAKDQIAQWLSFTYIAQATGFWLDQHAIDRGTRRQSGEADATLSARIRQVEDAVTVPALASATNAVLTASGVAGSVVIYENHRGHAFWTAPSSTSKRFRWGRGQRWGGTLLGTRLIVLILPFGTPTAVASAILDAANRKKGGGYAVAVETAGVAAKPRTSVTPPSAKVATGGGSQQFAAQTEATGTPTWSVDGIAGGNATVGTVSAAGLYTAPASVPAGGAFDHVVSVTIGTSVGTARVGLS